MTEQETALDDLPWFADHANLITLTAWMAENFFEAKDIAYAVEKPWKFEAEFKLAQASA